MECQACNGRRLYVVAGTVGGNAWEGGGGMGNETGMYHSARTEQR